MIKIDQCYTQDDINKLINCFHSFFAVIADLDKFVGCVNISSPLFKKKVTLKAHEADPLHCNELCRGQHFHVAVISLKSCYCTNDNHTGQLVGDGPCKARCKSNTSLICGGDGGFGSAYRTG